MIRTLILPCLLFLLVFSSSANSQTTELPMQLKNLQKFLENSRKLAKDKTIEAELRVTAKTVERARNRFEEGKPQYLNAEVDTTRRRLLSIIAKFSSESAAFQEAIRNALKDITRVAVDLKLFRAETTTEEALYSVTFSSPDGWIRVRLPNDARSGETISGTVVRLHREGIDPSYVNTYQLDVMNTPVEAGKTRIVLNVPMGDTEIRIKLKDLQQNSLLESSVPLKRASLTQRIAQANAGDLEEEAQPTEMMPDVQIPHLKFSLPPIGLGGLAFHMSGPFDGDIENTSVQVNRTAVSLLAESPRRVVFALPREDVGQITINVRENGVSVRCRVQALRADVVPPKPFLAPGETTQLRIIVYGLPALKKPVMLQLRNETSKAVLMDDKPEELSASRADAGGVFSFDRQLTGITAEPFQITPALQKSPEIVCEPPAR